MVRISRKNLTLLLLEDFCHLLDFPGVKKRERNSSGLRVQKIYVEDKEFYDFCPYMYRIKRTKNHCKYPRTLLA